MSKTNYFALFGKCEDKWYPLINEYENENELFYIFETYTTLAEYYNTNNIYYDYRQKYRVDHYKFLQYIHHHEELALDYYSGQ